MASGSVALAYCSLSVLLTFPVTFLVKRYDLVAVKYRKDLNGEGCLVGEKIVVIKANRRGCFLITTSFVLPEEKSCECIHGATPTAVDLKLLCTRHNYKTLFSFNQHPQALQ